ncbi:MAG: amidohydrolase family protein [Fimbriimonadaceae bacterium]
MNNVSLFGRPESRFTVENGKFASFSGSSNGAPSKYVLPGFIDAHCHILPTGLDLAKLQLDDCKTQEDVFQAVADWEKTMEPGAWLHAVHYDQTKFNDAKHIVCAQLDAISSTRPILLRHVNGHASIANSAALKVAGVDHTSPDPDGGEFGRDDSGQLNGVLLEKAHEIVTSAMPEPSLEEMTEAILLAASEMSKLGITAATDMMTGRWNLEKELMAYHAAAERGSPVRFRLYVQWATVLHERKAIQPELLRELTGQMNPDLCRMEGLKVFADGAIGRQRLRSTHDSSQPAGVDNSSIPKLILPISSPKSTPTDGSALSTQSVIDPPIWSWDAYEKFNDPTRHRIEHAMILSDQQIDRLANLGCHVTMQPEFLHWFGHAYRAQLEPEISSHLAGQELLDKGIRLSFNSDRPIVGGNPWMGIGAAVSRPEGLWPARTSRLKKLLISTPVVVPMRIVILING